jgi:uncharacterized repeat protein (TIGR02543 family)
MGVNNLILENPNIIGRNYVGGISGFASGYSYSGCLQLENLAVNNGTIVGNSYVGGISGYVQGGGALTGACTDAEKKRFDVHSLFNSATIQANDNYAAGIFGYLTNYRYQLNSGIVIHDIQNIGIINSQHQASGLISSIYDNNAVVIEIDNALSTGPLTGESTYGIFGEYNMRNTPGKIGLSNVYYSSTQPFINNYSAYLFDGFTINKKTAYELTNINKWDGFDDYWIQENINDKPRIPLLKMMENNFNYLSIIDNTINVNMLSDDRAYITEYIEPNNDLAKNNTYLVNNDNIIVSPNGLIIPYKKGESEVTIKSLYDGSQHVIIVNVGKPPVVYYHSNFDDDVYQQIIDGTDFLESNRFVRTGYTFDGWNTKADGTGELYQNQASINITDDIHLYAQWSINHYTVSFNLNNDTSIEPIDITYGTIIDLSDINPIKEGHVFAGWYFDSKFNTPFKGNEIISENITLHAKWIENNFNVDDHTSYELVDNYIAIPEKLAKDSFDITSEFTYEILPNPGNSESNTINTGDIIIIYVDNIEIDRYELVILGDANGDGTINSGDLFRVQQHLLNLKSLEGIYRMAADYNKDDELNSGDLYWICKYLIDNRS